LGSREIKEMDYGLWGMDYGKGIWIMDYGVWIMGKELKIRDLYKLRLKE